MKAKVKPKPLQVQTPAQTQPSDMSPAPKRPTVADLLAAGLTYRDVRAAMSQLFERWPEVFRPKRRPLKVHIRHDILAAAPDIHPVALGLALQEWCAHPEYLQAMLGKQHRHNLDGSDASDITAAEREHARTRLERMRKRRELRKAAAAGADARGNPRVAG
jgi:sRNA-binding protein